MIPASPHLPTQTDVLTVGTIIDDYKLQYLLGAGGSGTVFKAQKRSTGQSVALKLLRADTDNPLRLQRVVARFERETHLCAQMHHPNIVGLLDKGQAKDGQLYAVFEYVPGETLKDYLFRNGALSALEAGYFMGQVLDALTCAHALGIAHRDLKPQNIMLMSTGTRMHLKILDFGIASFIPERQKAEFRDLTMTAEMMCSPSYSAPEHLRGEPPTVKIDLYAWGLLFIECLTGRPAIEGITLADIFHQQLSSSEVPLPPALVGHPLADLLRRALRKNPRERAESAAALYLDFQKINLADIVGDLTKHLNHPVSDADYTHTQEYTPNQIGFGYLQQQLSVLSCTLDVTVKESKTDPEVLEALQRDQLSACTDTAVRYGGHLAGTLGNSLLFYFGYPHVTESDARRCARTALELTSQVRRRAALLCAQGFDMDLRVGIHTGMVRILPGQLPTGLTPNTAMQLAQQAQSGEVLASATSRKILAQYVEFSDAGKHIQTNDGESLPYFAIQGEFKAETLFLMRRGKMSQGMVGREEEFVQLQKTWQQVCSGQGCAVLLQGEAGIGKSRLSYEICTHVRQQAASVLEVRCLPEYQNNALQPILTLLKKHLSLQDAIPQEAVARLQTALLQAQVKLEWVLPILCSWLALPMPEQFPAMQFSPERQKSLLLDALQSLIFQFAHGQHLLFLVEDMHWIDQTSQELLDRMLKALGQQAVLLLMSARPGFVNPWPTLVEVVQLGRLSEAAAGQLVNTMLGGQAIDATDLARLCQRTDGVPLFLEELTRMLLDSQLLVERSGVYQLDARFDTSDIPVTLRDLLSARLARLGPAIDTAQLAAAIGREFDYALLLEVALTDEATLQTHLEQLITADLVHRQRRVTGDSYIFRHALIRDAAYDTMPKKIREQTHSRIGRQMARAEPAEIERNLATLAQHFAHALEFEPAVDYGTRAAQIFLKRALTIDALKQCEMVQHWTSTLGELVRRPAEIRINRILTSAYLFRFGLGDERVKRQADHELILMDGCDNVQMVFPSMWWLAYYHHLAGHREIVRALVGKLFELTSQSDDKGLLAASNVLHGFALWNEGDCVQAEAALSQAVQDYDPIAHADHCERFGRDTGIFAMSILSVVKRFTDLNDAVAFDMCEAAVARARERNHILTLGIALVFQAQIYHFVDDRDKALAVTTELLALTRQYSVPQLEIYGSILYAWATTNLSLAQKVLDVLCGLGGALGVPYYSSLVAEIEARAGDHVAAFERIQACLALATQVGEGYYKPELLIKSAEYRAKTSFSDPQQSRNDLQQAIAFAKTSGMRRCVQRASERLDFYS